MLRNWVYNIGIMNSLIKEAKGGFNEETVRKALKLLKRVKLLAVMKEKDLDLSSPE